MNTCLTCRHLREPDQPHKWHECMWDGPIAKAVDVASAVVNINEPYKDCPVWEARG